MKIIEKSDFEMVYIHEATVSSLAPYLNTKIPWIWILGHRPNRIVEWWESSLPINRQGSHLKAKFRSINFDIMLETKRFLKLIPEFNDHGIVLIQSRHQMPKTLDLSSIPDNQQAKVLHSNGAFLRMSLPHAYETLQIQCFEKGYLRSILT